MSPVRPVVLDEPHECVFHLQMIKKQDHINKIEGKISELKKQLKTSERHYKHEIEDLELIVGKFFKINKKSIHNQVQW